MTQAARITKTIEILSRRFPNPGAMEIGDHFHTLCAVVLSARTRDEQVLKLLPGFFAAFPTPRELGAAGESEIRSKINTIGMYKQKAHNLKRLGQRLVDAFGGKVPRTMDELVSLDGVGRKTASVVLSVCFGEGTIAVDTHVLRVTNRLGWVKTKTPEKTAPILQGLVPSRLARQVNRVFVKFGRYLCIGGRPRCWACPVRDLCAFKNKNLSTPKNADEVLADIDRREKELEALRRRAASV